MATSGGTEDQDTGDILCGICESQHITKCADHWCPECEEGLCSECEKHHSLLKPQEHMVLFQLKIMRNYRNLFQKLFITAKTMK
jgi:hypothetical protein